MSERQVRTKFAEWGNARSKGGQALTIGRRLLGEVKRAVNAAPVDISRKFRMVPEGGSGRNGKSWMELAEDRDFWRKFVVCVA